MAKNSTSYSGTAYIRTLPEKTTVLRMRHRGARRCANCRVASLAAALRHALCCAARRYATPPAL
eukprot:6197509-Pleurochrysis_carterae.AAC.3